MRDDGGHSLFTLSPSHMSGAYQVNCGVNGYGSSLGLRGVKIVEDFGLLGSPKVQTHDLCIPPCIDNESAKAVRRATKNSACRKSLWESHFSGKSKLQVSTVQLSYTKKGIIGKLGRKEGKTKPQREIPLKPRERPFTYIRREKPFENGEVEHRKRIRGNIEKRERKCRDTEPRSNTQETYPKNFISPEISYKPQESSSMQP
ncbi:hypothetical protein C1H46_023848 [Malus baccata]|uniref:Uncharacterized protein n=1 Tax=Malus baccata TaxID=106549 RepID=A0A540LVS2_MALBA|nr:hypothetical protein C1H46_023848 [Malus baccata]